MTKWKDILAIENLDAFVCEQFFVSSDRREINNRPFTGDVGDAIPTPSITTRARPVVRHEQSSAYQSAAQ
ncbi:MAG: hypothetical protein R3C05_16650 [Pirellulaceae bacterium]